MTLLKRMFMPEIYKGEKNYIKTQTRYEIIKTVLLFAVSGALYLAGYLATGSKTNLLTIVAVLGCLPAAKSAVNMIMFLRYKSMPLDLASRIEEHSKDLPSLYDCVFTSYDKNYQIDHIVYKDKCICGYTRNSEIDEDKIKKHLNEKLLVGGHKGLTIKIFTSEAKYLERLDQLNSHEDAENEDFESVLNTLRAICL